MGILDGIATFFLGKPEPAQLQEGVFMGAVDYDPDASLSATQGGSSYYRRLTGKIDRDLNPITQERARAIAFWLYDSNPLAKRVLELTRDFLVGDGVGVAAQGEDEEARKAIQEVIDRFWGDPINLMDLKLFSKVLELGLWGEQCYSVTVNPVDGHVRLGYVDPGLIADVLLDPKDGETPREVVLTGVAAESGKRLKVISFCDDPNSPWFGRLMGVATDRDGTVLDTWQDRNSAGEPVGEPVGEAKPYLGACFLFRINAVSNARRGRSDLLSLADWIDAYDQVLFNEVDRAILMKSFIWDVAIEGDEKAVLDAQARYQNPPKPGSLRIHNTKEKWEAVNPEIKSYETKAGADLLLGYISTGSGHPKTWLSGTDDVNRATATELSEPAFKRLSARQRYVRYMIEQIVSFVLDQAEMKGKIGKREVAFGLAPAAWSFSVTMPEIRSKDMKLAADTFNAAMQALASALVEELVDKETAQELVAMLIGQFGVDVDLEAMRERLAQAAEEKATVPPAVPALPSVDGIGADGEVQEAVRKGADLTGAQDPFVYLIHHVHHVAGNGKAAVKEELHHCPLFANADATGSEYQVDDIRIGDRVAHVILGEAEPPRTLYDHLGNAYRIQRGEAGDKVIWTVAGLKGGQEVKWSDAEA